MKLKCPFTEIEDPKAFFADNQKELAAEFARLRAGKLTPVEELVMQLEPQCIDQDHWNIVYEESGAVFCSGFTSEDACWTFIRGIKTI